MSIHWLWTGCNRHRVRKIDTEYIDSGDALRKIGGMKIYQKKLQYWLFPLLLTGLFMTGCAQNRCLVRQQEVMKPRRIVLRDEAGIERAMLVVKDNEARLVLRNASGGTLFDFNFSEAGLHIEMQDETDKPTSATITTETLH